MNLIDCGAGMRFLAPETMSMSTHHLPHFSGYRLWLQQAALAIVALLGVAPGPVRAETLVRFSTSQGNFTVALYDDTMPYTVDNFLRYVRAGLYSSTIFHRSTTYNPATIQIVQGGGFALSGTSLNPIVPYDPINLVVGPANTRGTLAMARTSAPNSATSQWYFNVTDNPGLDGNYAVFGRILGTDGMAVLDSLAAVPVYNVSAQLGGTFAELPLTQPSLATSSLVMVHSVTEVKLTITSQAKQPGGFLLNWTTSPAGLPVRVEKTTDLSAGGWTTISTSNTSGTYLDTAAPTNRAFYRLAYP